METTTYTSGMNNTICYTGDYTWPNIGTISVGNGNPWFTPADPIPSSFNTRKELKDYLKDKEVTKEIFEEIDERVPFGTDTLGELNKAKIRSPYLDTLNRERKLKRLLK